MTQTRVLIADDNSAVRDGLRSILARRPDIELLGEAANGIEAVAMAEVLRPDLVLMDAQMPRMDGIEATRRIKLQLPGVKVLFLTVHTEHIEAALEAGADRCLLKDCGRQELFDAIGELSGE